MAERPPAPEPLELVRQFVNTFDVESGSDELKDPSALAAWLASHGLIAEDVKLRAPDVRRVVAVREAMRALLLANNGEKVTPGTLDVLNDVSSRAPLEATFALDGTIGVEARPDGLDGALGQLIAIVVEAVADGTWGRLKVCRESTCHWAFYDRSRNRSSAWCVMAVCGNRNKARTYRSRQKES